MKHRKWNRFNSKGFALVATLLLIAMVVILLSSMLVLSTQGQRLSKIDSHLVRARQLSESAEADFLSKLSEADFSANSLIFALHSDESSSETILTFLATSHDVRPLFSSQVENFMIHSELDGELILDAFVNGLSTISNPIISEHSAPRGVWIELPNNQDQSLKYEYAFWVEDLEGRFRLAGESIDTSTIFDSEKSSDAVPETVSLHKDEVLTVASLRNFTDETLREKLEKNFVVRPLLIARDERIPFGFGYADQGLSKYDLNAFLENADVAGVAEVIRRNLPDFAQRKGGFPDDEKYLETLAASMIDYADTDSNASVGDGFRGVDSYPFVNEIFDRYEWLQTSNGKIEIEVETYIELWNPAQLAAEGEVQFTNLNAHTIRIPLVGDQQFTPVTFPAQQVVVPPNGFLVLYIGKHKYSFDEGAYTPTELEFIDGSRGDDIAENSYELHWNGNLVDLPRGGLQRTGGILRSGSGQRKWKGNGSPAHDHSAGQAGDPRASYYVSSKVIANSFSTNSNWGGRALKAGISAAASYREVSIPLWPDGGSNSTPGMSAGTDSRRPGDTQIMNYLGVPQVGREYPENQPDYAPARISNAGRYQSVAELGNIFDPAQWRDMYAESGTPMASAGGGITLAIGRPEYPVFDRDGWRAAQLLDLFTVRTSTPNEQININTAPREVLRALVADLQLTADPLTADVRLKYQSELGDLFADQVLQHRKYRPFRSVSDFARLREFSESNQINYFFGNVDSFEGVPLSSDQNQDVSWNDAGREELFQKLLPRVCFSSRTLKLVVAGRVSTVSGEVLARHVREIHYTIEPERDVAGNLVPQGRLNFTKIYEIRR